MPKTGLAAAAVVLLLGLPAAAGADPIPFATASGGCGDTTTTIAAPPQAAAHPDVLARYSTTAAGSVVGDGLKFEAGDVGWVPVAAVVAGGQPSVRVSCPIPGSMNVGFFDVPPVRTAVTGIGAGEPQWMAAGAGPYAADIVLSEGALLVEPVSTFAASGTWSITADRAGPVTVPLIALTPTPHWTITLRALPVSVTDLGVSAPVVRPGGAVTASYLVDGDTSVDGQLLAAGGQVVRTFAPARRASAPSIRPLTVDGRNDAGAALADGTYTLRVTSHDLNGLSSSADVPLAIDGTPPVMSVSPSAVDAGGTVLVTLADPGSGVEQAMIAVDEGEPVDYGHPEIDDGRVALRAGRKAGRHTLTAELTDKAGNTATVSAKFAIRPAMACSKDGALDAVRHAPAFRRQMRALHVSRHSARGVVDGFTVAKVVCRDLTGDGRRDMAVLLRGRERSAPTPLAVFRATDTGWSPGLSSTRRVVRTMEAAGDAIALRGPRYRRGDSTCCPSGRRRWEIVYSGGRFRLRAA